MSEQYPATDQPFSVSRLWQRVAQQLRQYTDQTGQKLGQVTEFAREQQQATVQYATLQRDQDPIQALRAHLPKLSRQLLVGRFASVNRLAQQLVPQEWVERVTDQLLEQTVQFAALISGNDALYDEFELLSLQDLARLELARADELADLVASRNRLLGAAEGAATGLAGFVGMIADLPLSVMIALRTIYQTAECYGYDLADVEGRQKIYQILAHTDWSVLVEKQTVLLSLLSVQLLLKQDGIAGLQHRVGSAADLEVFEKMLQELAGSLNIRLPDHLIGGALPVAGSVVGAFYNTRFINTVAALAQAVFRQQRLDELPSISQLSETLVMPVQTEAAPVLTAEGVFEPLAVDAPIKPPPKKRVVRVKKNSDGELSPNPTDVTPNSDTQH